MSANALCSIAIIIWFRACFFTLDALDRYTSLWIITTLMIICVAIILSRDPAPRPEPTFNGQPRFSTLRR